MAKTAASLEKKYLRALRQYLAHPGEEHLQSAYDLGRIALNRGLGVFDMARLHQQTLVNPIFFAPTREQSVRQAALVETFLLEALSPFEAAHRGFRKAWEKLQQLFQELEQSNRELRETRDHYFELFKQASAMEEDLRQLSAKVLTAQEEERKRISRDLHDEVGQALTAANVSIAMLRRHAAGDPAFETKVNETQALMVQTMDMVHRFARELRPASFDHIGAHTAFQAHLKAFSERTGIKTELQSRLDLNQLDAQVGIVLFRVAQESLTNVFKHAKATRVVLAFRQAGGRLRMEVRDNGCAFTVQADAAGAKWKGRLGLLGMAERVRLINGEFSIDSVPGRGTTVRVDVRPANSSHPLPKAAAAPGLQKAS